MLHSMCNYPIRMALVLALAVLVAVFAQMQTKASALLTNSYDLTWSTVDGGGTMFSVGGGYSLGGTIGQPDAGALGGGTYTLAGGFWESGAAQHKIYLPVVLRN